MSKPVADMSSDNARRILGILSDGGEGRFVGGCVRDFLVNKPCYDVDVATTHLPEKVIELCEAAGVKVIPTGLKHGTVTAVLDGQAFEITTLRKDVACDGRHAEVEYTDDWEQDAARRDFTFNAMYRDASGKIYDYFSGQEDLKKKIVRFVGDPVQRVTEDYLRILRLFRFQAYYSTEFSLPMQLEACASHISGLAELSGERVQTEMLKILSSPNPLYVLMVMNKLGVFNYIIAADSGEVNLDALKELLRLEKHEKDAVVVNPYIRLAAVMMFGNHQREKVLALCERWKLSSDDRNFLTVVLDQDHHIRSDMEEAQAKKEIRMLTKEYFISTCFVRWAAERAYDVDNKDDIDEGYRAIIGLATDWKIPLMPIRGRDLLDMGFDEGQEIGALLKMAEQVWEKNDYRTTRDELFELVRAEAG